MRRALALALAALLAVAALAAILVPFPLEMPLMTGSAILTLRHWPAARRLYVRGRRRWPRAFRFPDRLLRPRFRAATRVARAAA